MPDIFDQVEAPKGGDIFDTVSAAPPTSTTTISESPELRITRKIVNLMPAIQRGMSTALAAAPAEEAPPAITAVPPDRSMPLEPGQAVGATAREMFRGSLPLPPAPSTETIGKVLERTWIPVPSLGMIKLPSGPAMSGAVQEGLVELGGLANFVTSPEGIGAAIVSKIPVLNLALAGYFGKEMAQQMGQGYDEYKAAATPEAKGRALAKIGLGGAMLLTIGKGVKDAAVPTPRSPLMEHPGLLPEPTTAKPTLLPLSQAAVEATPVKPKTPEAPKAEAKPKAAPSTTGITEAFKEMGQAISANLYERMWKQLQAGKYPDIGPSRTGDLILAEYNKGNIKSAEDIRTVVAKAEAPKPAAPAPAVEPAATAAEPVKEPNADRIRTDTGQPPTPGKVPEGSEADRRSDVQQAAPQPPQPVGEGIPPREAPGRAPAQTPSGEIPLEANAKPAPVPWADTPTDEMFAAPLWTEKYKGMTEAIRDLRQRAKTNPVAAMKLPAYKQFTATEIQDLLAHGFTFTVDRMGKALLKISQAAQADTLRRTVMEKAAQKPPTVPTREAEAPAPAAAKAKETPAAKMQAEVTKTAQVEGKRSAKEIKDQLIEEIQQRLAKAPSEAKAGDTVTIDIPGDGEYTVFNTVEALSTLLERAKKIKTDPGKPPGVPRKAVTQSGRAISAMAGETQRVREAKAQLEEQKKLEAELPALQKAANASTSEGVVARWKSDVLEADDSQITREWRIRKATEKERMDYWKADKKEIRWMVERRAVKTFPDGRVEELPWLHELTSNSKADAFERLAMNPGAEILDPNLAAITAYVQGPEFYKEWKSKQTPPPAAGPIPPEHQGPGAASAGEFPQPTPLQQRALAAAARPLNKIRDTIRNLWMNHKPREAAAYTRDAGDNAAHLFARTQTSNVTGPLRRTFGKQQELADQALSFAIESGLTQEGLDAAREKVLTSQADGSLKKMAVDAIDFAKYNLDKLRPIAIEYRRLTGQQLRAERAHDIPTLEYENYVPHVQDIESEGGLLSTGPSGEATGFERKRTHPTFADSIAANVKPESLSASKLLQHRIANGQRLINRKLWVEGLKQLKLDDGSPFAVKPNWVTRADGKQYPQAPTGYKIEFVGIEPIAIRQGMERLFRSLTRPSWWSDSTPTEVVRSLTQGGKSAALLFDTFHLGRISFWDSLIKSLGVKTFELPIPEWAKGKKAITVLDTSPRELRRMAKAGEIPNEWLDDLLEAKRQTGLAIQTGFNIGRVSDALYSDLVDKIKPIGGFRKWLFEDYQRSAMMEGWRLEFQRRRMGRPDESELDSARYVSKVLNTRFGNLGRQGVFKSRTAQDTARFLALAPQWNEALVRSEAGALAEMGRFALDTAQGERLYAGLLMRAVGGMLLAQFAANQIINISTRGYPTWQNPEEGVGAKLSAWIPDLIGKGPGFFLHPAGLAAETTHLLTKAYERTSDSRDTLMSYLRSRTSTTMRPVLTFITKQDFMGRTLKPGTVWEQMAKDAVPTPIGAGALYQAGKAVVTGKREETFPGQIQRQIMSSVGVKTDQAPSPETRIGAMAKEFNAKKGIEAKGEFYTGEYSKLFQALRAGNEKDALEALRVLRQTKTEKQIDKHLKEWPTHPFTGQKAREMQFFYALNPDQQKVYQQAKNNRFVLAGQARSLVYQHPRTP